MSNTSLSIHALIKSTTKVEVVRILVSQYSKPSVSICEYESDCKFLEAASRLARNTESNIWANEVFITYKADGGWMVRESIPSTQFVKLLTMEMLCNTLVSLTKVFHRHDDGIESCRRDWEGNLKNVISLEEQERAIRIACDEAKYEWQMKDANDAAALLDQKSSTVADSFDDITENNDTQK